MNKIKFLIFTTLAALLPALALTPLVFPTCAKGEILMRWDFDGKDPFHNLSLEGEKPEVVNDPLVPGNHAMVSVLRTKSERSERSEVRWDRIEYGVERWVAVRILVPEPSPHSMMSIFQLGPVRNKVKDDGRGWFQLQMLGPSRTWILRLFLERVNQPGVRERVGPVTFGQWETWVMHFRLANDDKGFLELWRSGKKIYQQKGRNANPGDRMPIKWGVYIGIGNRIEQDQRVLYDDIVLGDEKSSYQEVTKRNVVEK